MQVPAALADFEFTPRKIVLGLLIVVALVGITLLYQLIDVKEVHRRTEEFNGFTVFALITVLPLLGFPISVAHAVAGMRFGVGLGLAIAAASIFLQMLASYALVKAMPKLFAKRLAPLRARLPKGAHGPVTLFTIMLPGAPYFAKNYVLPLIGVPLPTFLLWGLPIHILKSTVGLLFGDMSDDLSPMRITGFVVYAVISVAGCAWAFRRLQAQMKGQRPKAGDRTRRA